ncbi:MAG: hypothetical protein GX825_08925, partial [Syntrophomonadaceae bacterium]|nr:hypothetical protein [Syntrophomonadaceae bacterium]
MQRYLWCLALFFLIWLGGTGSADAVIKDPSSNNLSWQEMAHRLELEEMGKFKTSIDEEISGYLANGSVQEWLADFISGKWKFDLAEIGSSIWRFFIGEIMANGHLLGKILILAVVSALLVNLQSSFGEGVAKISSLACFLAISAIALGSFKYVMQIGQTAIDSMSSFMTAILPQMMILVTGLGHLHTATAVFPIMMVACTAFAKGIEWIIFPLITLSAVLHVTNCISATICLERLGKLVYTAAEI